MLFFIKVIASPTPEDLGKKFILKKKETTLGRDGSQANIQLKSSKISKLHCAFVIDSVLSVEDRKSANGTFVNGKKVDQAILTDRDRIVVGEITLEVGKEAA